MSLIIHPDSTVSTCNVSVEEIFPSYNQVCTVLDGVLCTPVRYLRGECSRHDFIGHSLYFVFTFIYRVCSFFASTPVHPLLWIFALYALWMHMFIKCACPEFYPWLYHTYSYYFPSRRPRLEANPITTLIIRPDLYCLNVHFGNGRYKFYIFPIVEDYNIYFHRSGDNRFFPMYLLKQPRYPFTNRELFFSVPINWIEELPPRAHIDRDDINHMEIGSLMSSPMFLSGLERLTISTRIYHEGEVIVCDRFHDPAIFGFRSEMNYKYGHNLLKFVEALFPQDMGQLEWYFNLIFYNICSLTYDFKNFDKESARIAKEQIPSLSRVGLFLTCLYSHELRAYEWCKKTYLKLNENSVFDDVLREVDYESIMLTAANDMFASSLNGMMHSAHQCGTSSATVVKALSLAAIAFLPNAEGAPIEQPGAGRGLMTFFSIIAVLSAFIKWVYENYDVVDELHTRIGKKKVKRRFSDDGVNYKDLESNMAYYDDSMPRMETLTYDIRSEMRRFVTDIIVARYSPASKEMHSLTGKFHQIIEGTSNLYCIVVTAKSPGSINKVAAMTNLYYYLSRCARKLSLTDCLNSVMESLESGPRLEAEPDDLGLPSWFTTFCSSYETAKVSYKSFKFKEICGLFSIMTLCVAASVSGVDKKSIDFSKLYADCCDVLFKAGTSFESVFDCIVHYAKVLIVFRYTGRFSMLDYESNKIETKYFGFCQNMESVRNNTYMTDKIKLPVLLNDICKYQLELEASIKMQTSSLYKTTWLRYRGDLIKFKDQLVSKIAETSKCRAPVAFTICGQPGIGKSTMITTLSRYVHLLYGIEDQEKIGTVTDGDNYDSTIHADTTCVVLDDLGQKIEYSPDATPVAKLIRFNSVNTTYAIKADVSEKGSVILGHSVLIITTNDPTVNAAKFSHSPYAVWRRMGLKIMAKLRPEYADEADRLVSGTLDSSRLVCFPYWLAYDIYDVSMGTGGGTKVSKLMENLDHNQLMRLVRDYVKDHIHDQDKLMEFDPSKMTICPLCNMVSGSCTCETDIQFSLPFYTDKKIFKDINLPAMDKPIISLEDMVAYSEKIVSEEKTIAESFTSDIKEGLSSTVEAVKKSIFEMLLYRHANALFNSGVLEKVYDDFVVFLCFIPCLFMAMLLFIYDYVFLSTFVFSIVPFGVVYLRSLTMFYMTKDPKIYGIKIFNTYCRKEDLALWTLYAMLTSGVVLHLTKRFVVNMNRFIPQAMSVDEKIENFNKEHSWAKPVNVLKNEISAKASSTGEEYLVQIVQNNILCLEIVHNGKMVRTCGLAINSSIIAVTRHTFGASGLVDDFDIRIRFDDRYVEKHVRTGQVYMADRDRDVCFILCPLPNTYKNLEHYLTNDPLSPDARPSCLWHRKNESGVNIFVEPIEVTPKMLSYSDDRLGSYHFYGFSYKWTVPTFVGLCGTPITTKGARRFILGIHSCATIQDGTGGGVPIYSSDVSSAVNQFGSSYIARAEYAGVSPTPKDIGYDPHGVPHKNSPVYYMKNSVETGGTIVASNTPSGKLTESAFFTQIKQLFCNEEERKTSYRLANMNQTRSHRKHMWYSAQAVKGPFVEYLQLAYNDYVSVIPECVAAYKLVKKPVRPLTLHEAINGCPEVHTKPIPKATSAGLGYGGTKQECLVGLEGDLALKPEYEEMYLDQFEMILEDQDPGAIMSTALKGEPKSYEEGVEMKEARVFIPGTLFAHINWVRYILPILNVINFNPCEFETALGVDSTSVAWHWIMQRIYAPDVEQDIDSCLWDCDFQFYDCSQTSLLTTNGLNVLLAIAAEFYSPRDLEITRTILSTLIKCMIAYRDVVVFSENLLPSGVLVTAHLNSINNALLKRCSFYKHHPPECKYRDYSIDITLGDDNVGRFTRLVDLNKWNPSVICDDFAQLGVSATSAKKDEKMGFSDRNDHVFLKRKTVFHEDLGHLVGVLDKKSIIKPFMVWVPKRKGSLSMRYESLPGMYTNALHEAFMYGRKEYDDFYRRLKILCVLELVDVNHSTIFKSYDERLAEKKKYCLSKEKVAWCADGFSLNLPDFDQACEYVSKTCKFTNLRLLLPDLVKEADSNVQTFDVLEVDETPVDGSETAIGVADIRDPAVHEDMAYDGFSLFNPEYESSTDVGNWHERAVVIEYIEMPLGKIGLQYVDPFDKMFKNGYIKDKMRNLYAFKTDLELTFQVSRGFGTFGVTMVTWSPLETRANLETNTAGGSVGDAQRSNRPHMMMDLCEDAEHKLIIPWIYPQPYYDNSSSVDGIASYKPQTLGVLSIATIAPLRNISKEVTDPVILKIIGKFKNFASGGTTVLQTDSFPNERVSGGLRKAGKVAGKVSAMTQGTSLALPSEIVSRMLDGAANVASLMGYSKPRQQEYQTMITPGCLAQTSTFNNMTNSKLLAVDNFNETTIDPAMSGISDGDTTMFENLMRRPTLIDTRKWTYGQPPKTIINSFGVTPAQVVSSGSGIFLPPCAMIAALFQYWTGGVICFRYKIYKASGYGGRLLASYDPTDHQALDITTQRTYSLDIRTDTELTIKIGWNSSRMSLLTFSDMLRGEGMHHTNGVITLSIDAPLIGVGTNIPEVTITTEIWAENVLFYGYCPQILDGYKFLRKGVSEVANSRFTAESPPTNKYGNKNIPDRIMKVNIGPGVTNNSITYIPLGPSIPTTTTPTQDYGGGMSQPPALPTSVVSNPSTNTTTPTTNTGGGAVSTPGTNGSTTAPPPTTTVSPPAVKDIPVVTNPTNPVVVTPTTPTPLPKADVVAVTANDAWRTIGIPFVYASSTAGPSSTGLAPQTGLQIRVGPGKRRIKMTIPTTQGKVTFFVTHYNATDPLLFDVFWPNGDTFALQQKSVPFKSVSADAMQLPVNGKFVTLELDFNFSSATANNQVLPNIVVWGERSVTATAIQGWTIPDAMLSAPLAGVNFRWADGSISAAGQMTSQVLTIPESAYKNGTTSFPVTLSIEGDYKITYSGSTNTYSDLYQHYHVLIPTSGPVVVQATGSARIAALGIWTITSPQAEFVVDDNGMSMDKVARIGAGEHILSLRSLAKMPDGEELQELTQGTVHWMHQYVNTDAIPITPLNLICMSHIAVSGSICIMIHADTEGLVSVSHKHSDLVGRVKNFELMSKVGQSLFSYEVPYVAREIFMMPISALQNNTLVYGDSKKPINVGLHKIGMRLYSTSNVKLRSWLSAGESFNASGFVGFPVLIPK